MSVFAEFKGLWIPPNAGELLYVNCPTGAPDNVFWAMVEMNVATNDFLHGRIPADVYGDMLAQHGIDPVEHVGDAWEHLDLLFRHYG